MKKLFVILTVICAVSAMAETKTLWSCGFEAEEGYQTGKVVGQCGWYKATGTITTRDVVAEDPGEAASGDQYLSYDPSVTDKGKVTAVKFDISDEYVIAPYNQLRISWDQARISRDYRDDTCYVILNNFGETGRSADIQPCHAFPDQVLGKFSHTFRGDGAVFRIAGIKCRENSLIF